MSARKLVGLHRLLNGSLRAIAAATAALALPPAMAEASVVNMVLDENLSSLSLAGSTVDLSWAVSGSPPGTVVVPVAASADFSGQGANGLVAHFKGNQYVDITASTITLQNHGAGYVIATGSAPVTHAQGAYIPNIDNFGNPSGTFPNPSFGGAPVDWGNFGISVPAVGAFARITGLSASPSSDYAPNGPLALSGPLGAQVFSVAPQIWENVSGRQYLVSGLGNGNVDLANVAGPGVGFPLPLGGTLDITSGIPVFTPNATMGLWDAITQTLTININGTVIYELNDELNVFVTQKMTGQLVMHPAVPEPASIWLFAIGVAGFGTWGWRRRAKRLPRQTRPG